MKDNIQEFKKIIQEIKNFGLIKTNRNGNTGIGKTLEDYCKIPENNHQNADFKGIEIKSQREFTGSYLTLFTKSPTFPRSANKILRLSYGSSDSQYPEIKVLHTSLFSNKFNTHSSGVGFSIDINRKDEKISILVKNLATNQIINQNTYWSFASIKNKIENKLKILAYISAKTEILNGQEHFHFDKAILLEGLSFDKFINLMEIGKVMIDIRVGAYKTGINTGKNHDHGTAFRIAKSDLNLFFDTIEEI